ncbi:MAG: hypothetical protein ABI876_12115 [Bacteroidota bacterium]
MVEIIDGDDGGRDEGRDGPTINALAVALVLLPWGNFMGIHRLIPMVAVNEVMRV